MNVALKADFYTLLINEFKSVNYNMKELPEEKKNLLIFMIYEISFNICELRKRFIGPGFRKYFILEIEEKVISKQNKK